MTTIGITIFPPKTGFSFWSNGAHQNCAFLWALFRHVPGVDRVFMINGGDGSAPDSSAFPVQLRDMTFAKMEDVIGELDVLIEAGAQVTAEAVAQVRAQGGRSITLKFGNSLIIDAEHAIHRLPHGSGIFNGAQFDEVWTTSQHAETCGAYWTTCYRAPLRVLPHVWEPWFVDMMTSHFPPGLPVGYQPGRERKRVAVMEPNLNIVKTCHVPMLIAELAYRQRPELFDRVMITNAIEMRGRAPFEQFAMALDVVRAKGADGGPMMSFEPRFNTPWFMSAHADVLVSHGWIDTPTYLHYDALHLGYPVVHNISGMPGYKYDGWDARGGAAVLLHAMAHHDETEREERAVARRFLETRRATAPANIEAHARALGEVRR